MRFAPIDPDASLERIEAPAPAGLTPLRAGALAALAWIAGAVALARSPLFAAAGAALAAEALLAAAVVALAPAVLIAFLAYTAHEARASRDAHARLCALADRLLEARTAAGAGDTAHRLRAELSALDAIVSRTGARLLAFEQTLRRQGRPLARSLAADIARLSQPGPGPTREAAHAGFAAQWNAVKRASAAAEADAEPALALTLAGRGAPENLAPPAPPPPPRRAAAVKTSPEQGLFQQSLPDLVAAAGADPATALSTAALDAIARAAAQGPEARRACVRAAAPETVRALSAYLRRDARARACAEALRREPAKALKPSGPQRTGPAGRAQTCAYLLVDAVLG